MIKYGKRLLRNIRIYLRHILPDKIQNTVGTSKTRKKLLLIIGPESTGTRLFTEILSCHPDILGTGKASEHIDILDGVWEKLERNELRRAMQAMPGLDKVHCLLTRRSMPHAGATTEAAQPMEFPNLWLLQDLCQHMNLELVILITTRSTAANLASWTLNRASSGGFIALAKKQYQSAYRYLFGFIFRAQVPFFFLSLEALLLDEQKYIQSIFQLLGLSEYPVMLDLHPDVNQTRYKWYSKQGTKGDMTR